MEIKARNGESNHLHYHNKVSPTNRIVKPTNLQSIHKSALSHANIFSCTSYFFFFLSLSLCQTSAYFPLNALPATSVTEIGWVSIKIRLFPPPPHRLLVNFSYFLFIILYWLSTIVLFNLFAFIIFRWDFSLLFWQPVCINRCALICDLSLMFHEHRSQLVDHYSYSQNVVNDIIEFLNRRPIADATCLCQRVWFPTPVGTSITPLAT